MRGLSLISAEGIGVGIGEGVVNPRITGLVGREGLIESGIRMAGGACRHFVVFENCFGIFGLCPTVGVADQCV